MDLLRDLYGMPLRRDVPKELGKHQEAWRGVRLIEAETMDVLIFENALFKAPVSALLRFASSR